MQCQNQVIFVFPLSQAGCWHVIPNARFHEGCFSHHCAAVPRTITAVWGRATPIERGALPACTSNTLNTCMRACTHRKKDTGSYRLGYSTAHKCAEITHCESHKTLQNTVRLRDTGVCEDWKREKRAQRETTGKMREPTVTLLKGNSESASTCTTASSSSGEIV